MQEKQEPVEKFYSQLTKLEHKINKHIKTIEHILQYPSDDDEEEEQANFAELDHNSRLIGKQIVKLKKQIDDALYQFQITSANTGQLNVRYNILRQSRKEVYQHNNQLKHKLENGREKLKRLKKLSHTLSALENEHSIEKTSVNKLQQAYNSAIKLQKQMQQKVEQLSNKQQNIINELQHQRDKDIQISQFWKTRQKYDKLVNHKNNIHKHIQSRVHESNKIYSNKSKELEYVNNKINNYAEVFHQLEVTTNQQNFIIKEIMLREGLTAQQLLQQVNVQYGEEFLLQEDFNKIKDEDYLKNQIKKFRRKIGTQASSTQKISQIGSRKGRVKTDNLHHMKQFSRIKYKYDELKSQRPQTMQNHLRMTTKIPLSQPNKLKNLNSIKSMQIYPTKLRNLQIKEKIYDQKINSPNLNSNKQKTNQQIQSQTQNLHKRLVQQNLTQSVYAIPITHQQLSSFSTPKHQKSKKISRNSQTKGINKFDDYSQKKSQIASKKQSNSDLAKQQKNQDLQFNFRIRTKQGYVYKTRKFNAHQSEHLDDLSSQNSSYFREKSEIIQLYDKLSKEKNPKKSKKETPAINDSAFSDINDSIDSLKESKQKQSNLGELSSYVKLNAIKRKKRQEGNKLTMESRQSDSEKMEKNEQIRNSHIKMESLKKTQKDDKNEDFQSKCQQIRKRLRTIHERQEQVIRGNSP